MTQDPFEEIYSRILDAELGLQAIIAILRSSSPGDEPIEIDRRNNVIEWCAERTAEQWEGISNYAEEQARAARTGRRS